MLIADGHYSSKYIYQLNQRDWLVSLPHTPLKKAECWKDENAERRPLYVFSFFHRSLISMVKWLATVIFSIESDFCQVSKVIVWMWVNSNYDTRTKKTKRFKLITENNLTSSKAIVSDYHGICSVSKNGVRATLLTGTNWRQYKLKFTFKLQNKSII